MSIKPITLILNKLSIKNDKINEANPNQEPIEPKKRGRPRKNIITNEDREKLIEPRKRGRPKKNTTPNAPNKEELIEQTKQTEQTEQTEAKKRGRPKKNITITNDTSSESSSDNEPKKRGRPKNKPEVQEESDNDNYYSSSESECSDSEGDAGEEVEGFYIKLDNTTKKGYIFVSSISESEYIIRPNFKLYNPHTFIYCGMWDPVSKSSRP